jgi:hypothetical protein
VKNTFGGTATASGRDLKAVIPIQKTGMSMTSAKASVTSARRLCVSRALVRTP